MLVPVLTQIDDTTYTLSMWNSSSVSGLTTNFGPGTGNWFWRPPTGSTLDWRTGIQWTVTVPGVPGLVIDRIDPEAGIIYASTGSYLLSEAVPVTDAAFDVTTGKELWIITRPAQPSWHVGPMA